MAAVFKSFGVLGPASALLLLAALLAAGARADHVTTAECEAVRRGWGRVRQYPEDNYATLLDMSSCNLTGIEQGSLLTGLIAVTELYLSYNKLRELPVFDEHVCANLTGLDLDNNQLTSINNAGTFSACTKLEILQLSYNQIHFIHTSAFTALTNLKYLDLYNNKIRFIPDQMFSNNGKLRLLTLSGNRLTHLPPDFASRLKRAGGGLDWFTFNDNPLHCACLIELLADVRRAGVGHYKKENYSGTKSVCNYISMRDYPCRKIREINFIAHGVR